MTRFLNIENIVLFHEKIIKETGGSAGIRDRGLNEGKRYTKLDNGTHDRLRLGLCQVYSVC